MCVCVCVCVFVCVFVCVCGVNVSVFMCVCMCLGMYVCMYACMRESLLAISTEHFSTFPHKRRVRFQRPNPKMPGLKLLFAGHSKNRCIQTLKAETLTILSFRVHVDRFEGLGFDNPVFSGTCG